LQPRSVEETSSWERKHRKVDSTGARSFRDIRLERATQIRAAVRICIAARSAAELTSLTYLETSPNYCGGCRRESDGRGTVFRHIVQPLQLASLKFQGGELQLVPACSRREDTRQVGLGFDGECQREKSGEKTCGGEI